MKIYGRKILKQTLQDNPELIDKVFILNTINKHSIKDILKLIKENKIVHNYVPKERLNSLVKFKHQGLVAFVSPVKYYTLDDINSEFVIILDRITDNHNLGAIIRTAAATGIHFIIIPKRHSATVNEVVVKVSAGGINYVKIVKVSNLSYAIDFLKEKGFFIIGTSLESKKFYKDVKYKLPLALILGSEGEGIKKSLIKKCDFLVKIPIKNIQSLNVSVSAGIIIYHIMGDLNEKEN